MSESLKNKVALVTGSAVRIGAAIVRELHSEGASVAIHYRSSADAAEELAAELNALRPESAKCFQADLLVVAELEAMAKAAIDWRGRLDVLVNNASSFYPTPLGSITESQWDDLLGSNLKAPLFLTQATAPALRKTSGCIINIVDIHSQRPLKDHRC
jgi:pteridine reductase